MQIINPSNHQVISHIQEDSVSEISQKYWSAKSAQLDWQKEPLEKRIEKLQLFFDLLEKNKEKLASVLSSEVGKPLQQSRNEINGAKNRIQWMLKNAARFLSEETMHEEDGLKEIIRYEPLGVIGNISAWNYPYLVGVNVFVPALLAGNAVLYKPSEFATLTGIEIAKLLHEAGIPELIFQIVIGAREAGEALLNLPLDGYFFTGSYQTGQYIYERVAAKMVPCQCELGGKDPLYVTDEIADIKNVAIGTADGAFYNNGQSCCSVERIYVHEKVYDDYVNFFVEEVKSWKVGEASEEGVYIAALTRPAQIKVLENQVADAIKKGATILYGGKKIARAGNYFEPTVLVHVDNTMEVMQEESFGPIIGIMKVKNDEEAIQLMNDSKFGLTASVYSSNQDRANAILSKMNSGTAYWNCCDRVSAALPWAGRKQSGFGATLSHQGIRAFTKTKSLHLRA